MNSSSLRIWRIALVCTTVFVGILLIKRVSIHLVSMPIADREIFFSAGCNVSDVQFSLPVDVSASLREYRDSARAVEDALQEQDAAVAHAAAPLRSDNKRGVYLNPQKAGDDRFLIETLERLTSSSGNALVFDVKGSRVFFSSTSSIAKEKGIEMPLFELANVLSLARQKGVYTIARLVAAKDAGFGSRESSAQIRHPQTGVSVGYEWVDLGSPSVLEYNRQVIRDLAAAGVDEINLDYIRYPTEYAQWQIGLGREEKVEHIEAFIRMARATIDEYGPQTKLGISTYAILGWHYDLHVQILGQDIVKFAPLVDVISPMAYPQTFAAGAYYNPAVDPGSRSYYLVYRTMLGYADLLDPEHHSKLRPWLQAYFMTDTQLKDEMRAVYDAGLCGFTFWSAGNVYHHVYRTMPTVDIPERCLENL